MISQSPEYQIANQKKRASVAEENILFKEYFPARNRLEMPRCETCVVADTCRKRISNGAWAPCERPDKDDLRRVKTDISEYDEELMGVYYLEGEVVAREITVEDFFEAAEKEKNPYVR